MCCFVSSSPDFRYCTGLFCKSSEHSLDDPVLDRTIGLVVQPMLVVHSLQILCSREHPGCDDEHCGHNNVD